MSEIATPRAILSARQGTGLHVSRIGDHASQLMGYRQFRRPYLAMTSSTNMGPARHVLAQMVVAGVVHHQPALIIKVNPNEYSADSPKSAR